MTNVTVLLLGGSSGVGKTTIAAHLAPQLGMTWGSVDDVRLVLERMTTPDHQPALHFFFQHLTQLAPEDLAQRYQAVAAVVSYALEIIVANHVATAAPLLLEGDTITPSMAAQRQFADLAVDQQVRAVFLVESDEAIIRHNMLERGRGIEQASPQDIARMIRFSWLHGQWLQHEARRYGLPVIAARPRETVIDRILAAIAQ
ncbi:MAG: AAA family ATPase [Chloroflexota bacterium]|nr:AAA family ATPase [Chloroflexota bacterium]